MSADVPLDRVLVARGEADAVVLDQEAVVLVDGELHLLNPTAALVWGCCDGTASVRSVAAELAGAFAADPDAVAADVVAVAGELARRGLVVPAPAPDPAAAAAPVDAGVRVLPPEPGCAGCGDGPDYEQRVLVRVGADAVWIGADHAAAAALVAGLGPDALAVVDEPTDRAGGPPSFGLVLPDGGPERGIQPVARLQRGAEVLLRSRDPERVVHALAAQLASLLPRSAGDPVPLHALAVGGPGGVVLVPVPANRVAYERAAAVGGLGVSGADVVFLAPHRRTVVLGAPGLALDLDPLLRVAATRRRLGGEPAALAAGAYPLAGIAVPGRATGATVLAELAPARRVGVDPVPAVGALLGAIAAVPIASGVEPAALRAGLLGAARAEPA
jgi:hypothetical protein